MWTQAERFENAAMASPALSISMPSRAISGNGLAVLGNSAAATVVGSALSVGGGSTTLLNSIGSPLGLTASTGAVFRASTGDADSSIGVSSTGSLVSLANCRALDLV